MHTILILPYLFLACILPPLPDSKDVMMKNPAAITTRAAKSFVRVGHVELMGRRARKHASDATAQSQLQVSIDIHILYRVHIYSWSINTYINDERYPPGVNDLLE